ncbi:MFS transporter [Nakamurella alba]|uniref:MFS transporter n=1 Tax=Nakamurella alba TaxID=2665158 RepID=UPI0018AB0318|nr:MFS transporter [Nakamurella alba]
MIQESRPSGRALLVATAVVLLAAALRPPVNALGAVIPELRDDTGLNGAAAGLLLALPTLCFAVIGFAAPVTARRLGTHRTVQWSLVALTVGQLVRVLPGPVALFGGSTLALAGVAMANVLLPGLVRLHFPHHIPAMTAVWTTVMSAGGAVATGVTLPAERALGGDWRLGIGMWAALSAVTLLPWLMLGGRRARPVHATRAIGPGIVAVARTRLGWMLAGYFGTQALQAYVIFGWLPELLIDQGMTDTRATAYVSILGVVAVLISAVVPFLLKVLPTVVVIAGMAGCYLTGYVGLLVAPVGPAALWCVLIGLGTGAFPVALTLVALRARTQAGTTALSGFTQSIGYLIASSGPVLFGFLHDLSGAWDAPLLLLCGLLLVHLGFGLLAARPRIVEDELPPDTARD